MMTETEVKVTIEYLKEVQEKYIEGNGYERHPLPEWYALDIAIKALEQEHCEDVIDRAEAMTEIMMFVGNVKSDEGDIYIKVSDAVQLLRELPPVTPKPKVEKEPTIDILDKIRNELLLMECMEEAVEVVDKYRLEIPFDGRDEE